MQNLKRRNYEPELMDGEDIPFTEFQDFLRSLETINILTTAYRPTLRWLQKMMTAPYGEPLHILDAGCGNGDMLRRVERLALHKKQKTVLSGVDLHPWSRQSAEASYPVSSIRYKTADIFSFEPEEPVDFIICSLFTHHLDDEQLIRFLSWIDEHAARGWFINDLHRHIIPYYFIKLATGMFSRNRLIRNDAAVSVARAFSVADWQRMLDKAGIGGRARVQWFFPFRLCVSCKAQSVPIQ